MKNCRHWILWARWWVAGYRVVGRKLFAIYSFVTSEVIVIGIH